METSLLFRLKLKRNNIQKKVSFRSEMIENTWHPWKCACQTIEILTPVASSFA
jgi:hypothetical protein